MNKNCTLRMVLAALLLAVGVNFGWAQTTLYERGTTTAWSDSDLSDWTTDAGLLSINDGLYAITDKDSNGNGKAYTTTKSLSVNEGSKLTISATWNTGESTGRAGGYNYLKFGDVELRAYGQDPKTTIVIGRVETEFSNGNYAKLDARGDKDWTIDLTIDLSTKEVNYTVVLPTSGSKTGSGISTSSNISDIQMGYYKAGQFVSTHQTLKAINVAEEIQDVEMANYTIYYLDESGEELKTSSIRSGKVGDAVIITDADVADFYTNNIKYHKVSIEGENAIIASDNSTVVKIIFEALAKFTAQIDAYDNESETLIKEKVGSGEGYEGDEVKVYFPKGVQDDNGNWYMKDQLTTDGNGLWYGMTFTGEEVGEVYYDLNEDIKYYAEVENLTPSRSWAAYGNATNRYSAGKAVRFAKGASTTTDAITEAGTYYFTLFARNQSSSSSSTLNVYVVDTDGTETLVEEGFENWGTADMSAKTITVTIPSGGKLKIENPSTEYNSNIEMDYLYLQLKPEMYNAIINAVDESGTLLTELKNEEVIKGETKTLYFSKGLQIDGVWYIADQLTTAGDGLWYGAEFEEGNTVDVVFKKNTDIVYFAEMEDLTPSRSYATTASKQVTNRTSNGKIGRLAKGSYVKTASLPEGTYNITLWGRSSASSDANVEVFIEDASGAQTEITNGFEAWAGGGAGTGEKTITGIEVPAGGAIVLKNTDTDNNSNLEMDYIYIDTKPVSNVSTAIQNVQVENEDNSVYNMQGQRVSQPTHGIFVKNGKKVIMK